jgi:hypothetical protein
MMSTAARSDRRFGWLMAGAVLAPLPTSSLLAVLLKWGERTDSSFAHALGNGPFATYVFQGISLLPGLICLLSLPIAGRIRALVAVPYLLVMRYVLMLYLIVFACWAFHDCL